MLDFSNSHYITVCLCEEKKVCVKLFGRRQNNNSTIFAFDFFPRFSLLINNYDIRWIETVGLDQERANTHTHTATSQWLKNIFKTFANSSILQHQLFWFDSRSSLRDTLEKCWNCKLSNSLPVSVALVFVDDVFYKKWWWKLSTKLIITWKMF